MARTTKVVQTFSVDGPNTPTYTSPGGDGVGNGFTIAHSDAAPTILIVKNGGGSTAVVTIKSNGSKDKGVSIPDKLVSVAAGAEGLVWCPPAFYSGYLNAGDNLMVADLTTGAHADVSIAAFTDLKFFQ